MFVNETQLRAEIANLSNGTRTAEETRSRIPFELVQGIETGDLFSREGAIAVARVLLSDPSDRSAMRKADRFLRDAATVTATDATLRGAIEFERASAKGRVREYAMASERFALATGRVQDERNAKRYNIVGAGRKLSADDVTGGSLAQGGIPYGALPRYTEAEAQALGRIRSDAENERETAGHAEAEREAHEMALAFALRSA